MVLKKQLPIKCVRLLQQNENPIILLASNYFKVALTRIKISLILVESYQLIGRTIAGLASDKEIVSKTRGIFIAVELKK